MSKKFKSTVAIVTVLAVVAVIIFAVVVALFLFGNTEQHREPDSAVTFEKMTVDAVWQEDRTCKVRQSIDMRFNASRHGIYAYVPVKPGVKVRRVAVTTSPIVPFVIYNNVFDNNIEIRIGDEDALFARGDTLNCTIAYDYITPAHDLGPDVAAFMPIGDGCMFEIESATVNVVFPEVPEIKDGEYGVFVNGYKVSSEVWTGNAVTITTPLSPFQGVEVACKLPDGTFHDHYDNEYLVTLILGALLFAAAVVIKLVFARNKPLTPIVDYYPLRVGGGDDGYFDTPDTYRLKVRRMLPVQMGKIIDDYCSSEDVTSLIFYWASKGFIAIDDRKDDTYFVKLHELDPITLYEKRLFDRMFSFGSANEDGHTEVGVKQLTGKFGSDVNKCKADVNAEYKGKFYSNKLGVVSMVLMILSMLYGAGMAMFSMLRMNGMGINLIGVVAFIPSIIAYVIGTRLAKNRFKLTRTKRILFTTGYVLLVLFASFGSSLVIPKDIMSWGESVMYTLFLSGALTIAPFILVRKPEYNDYLNRIIGFRDFLRDAEKDRLETLLAEDPQYFYDILPYANVLGVSDIWSDKFKDITIAPPDYYTSYNSTLFDYIIIMNLSRSLSGTLSYVPSSGHGSSSGGGFGGGGFSGGSFGGGGFGSW